jgi:hypothetical protein
VGRRKDTDGQHDTLMLPDGPSCYVQSFR